VHHYYILYQLLEAVLTKLLQLPHPSVAKILSKNSWIWINANTEWFVASETSKNSTRIHPQLLEFFVSKIHTIEWLCERTEHLNIFLFSAHHSMVFCFRCSVYWWNGSVRF